MRRRMSVIIIMLVFSLMGCRQALNEERGNDQMEWQREELVEKIIERNPLLRNKLEGHSIEELEGIYEELQEKRQQKAEDLLREMDEEKQLDEKERKHHHDPRPPEPPIYEKPRPVPDPPIEEE